MHRGAFFGIERPILNGRLVGYPGHGAAQGVNLPDELALGHPPDRGTAGHGGHLVQIDDRQKHAAPHAGSGERRLAAGMAGANHDKIKFARVHAHKGNRGRRNYWGDAPHRHLSMPSGRSDFQSIEFDCI